MQTKDIVIVIALLIAFLTSCFLIIAWAYAANDASQENHMINIAAIAIVICGSVFGVLASLIAGSWRLRQIDEDESD